VAIIGNPVARARRTKSLFASFSSEKEVLFSLRDGERVS
jgi:hypothetical protein